MKLYAQVTSERASKGQGGNNWLDIKLTITDNPDDKRNAIRHEIGTVRLLPVNDGILLQLDRSNYGRIAGERGVCAYRELINIKGKQQKDEA
jgi:hypothetical protein